LNQLCLSIDSLVDLFAVLRATVVQGFVDGDSAHGVHARKGSWDLMNCLLSLTIFGHRNQVDSLSISLASENSLG
jgi:hypothetical protein